MNAEQRAYTGVFQSVSLWYQLRQSEVWQQTHLNTWPINFSVFETQSNTIEELAAEEELHKKDVFHDVWDGVQGWFMSGKLLSE